MHRIQRLFGTGLLAAVCFGAPALPQASPDLLLILDASGSMWGQIEGENKIVIARRVLKDLIQELPADAEAGLVAYGHRREGDCEDVEAVVPMGPLDKAALSKTVESLNPKGKTPITIAVNQAFELARHRQEPTTVVLVSDGVETCGGDPCQAVRAAREVGIPFVMHVVGFDVGDVDVAQLECAAQEGGGLYLDAGNAAELSAALDQAVAVPADLVAGRLSVKVVADGELSDALVVVTDTSSGEEAARGRTYTAAETNPRVLPLAAGGYEVEVSSLEIEGNAPHRFEVVISEEATVEKVVDFSSGELAVLVTRNEELSDATVLVYSAGKGTAVAQGRTYTRSQTNPRVFHLPAGEYDVEINSVEIAGKASRRFEGVRVEPRARAEREHAFVSGLLSVGAVHGTELVDATVRVLGAETGKPVDQGRTYTDSKSNPKRFELSPGRYRVVLRAVRLEGKPSREIEVTVEVGETTKQTVDFSLQ